MKTYAASKRWWRSGGARPCDRCGIDLKPEARDSTRYCQDCINDPMVKKRSVK